LENLKRPLGRLGVDVKIILKRILNKYGVNLWTRYTWFRMGCRGGLL
jgi:hypothetical protein